jgi:hypothetical protein
MTSVGIANDSEVVLIVGHGVTVAETIELAPGVLVTPEVPRFEVQEVADGTKSIAEYASVLTMVEHATFAIRVSGLRGKGLAAKAWNALWQFHLLSLAAQSPCCSLYSVADGAKPTFAVANRHLFFAPFERSAHLTRAHLTWAAKHQAGFDGLVKNPRFSTAMRCFGNAHYLPDFDMRIMLLWSGIEGLLGVDAELSRRVAQYAALLHKGSQEDREAHYRMVRKSYAIRSKAVHGAGSAPAVLIAGYQDGSAILAELLARCVEIGEVPSCDELDASALTSGYPGGR